MDYDQRHRFSHVGNGAEEAPLPTCENLYFRLVRGASSPATEGNVESLRLGNVFVNSGAQTPIDRKPTFDDYGESYEDPLIVRVPEVWYQLEDASTRAAFAGTLPRPAPLPEGDTVEDLLNVVYDANRDVLAGFVPSQLVAETPLIVMVPQREVYGAPPAREFRNIVEIGDESDLEELRRYHEQGRLIRDNCKDFCLDNEKAVFICECAYLEQDVDIGEVRGILTGVETEWVEDWNVIIVFCSHLNICRTDWAPKNVGCVKLTRGERPGTVIVTWVFQPKLEEREKLVVVTETGMITEA
ncbi:hypothetical protein PHYSODRAFT_325315 [Phytophthora sojae]|uniref:Uncharacterized protein n=1 Tax=Phytophthora sojae (strain P6497) TaxID=1094619 RepID=G4YSQ4_PHYSP|nr:hypothetical protein PHYSODRAFT_325315 [Phytophthora sojae]EGZ24176.1 hypothetical protein PHYSODRAFT_325315 [Phytophthora sojae]|eukprot:XP_009519464.1 hypothetical protein PHYSODRAFT_325315 [Phytophthora sojae]